MGLIALVDIWLECRERTWSAPKYQQTTCERAVEEGFAIPVWSCAQCWLQYRGDNDWT